MASKIEAKKIIENCRKADKLSDKDFSALLEKLMSY